MTSHICDRLDTENLDPSDWEGTRALGHQIVDHMIEYLRSVRDRPVFAFMPSNVLSEFESDAPPRDPADLADVYAQFVDKILPYPMGR